MISLNDDIFIRPMLESDLTEVIAIETSSFPNPWNLEHFLDEIKAQYSFPLVSLNGSDKLTGYICPMLLFDEGHIMNVAVRKGFRGRGVGKLMIEKVLAECREKDAAFLSLEVRISNLSAISLYQRLGFIETGQRKKYYENGEDAILMEYLFSLECSINKKRRK
jgi:ribosomal-protein-alanine N-acetyltransferase